MNRDESVIPGLPPKRRGKFSLFGMFICLVLVVGSIAFVNALNRKRGADPDDPSNWSNMPDIGQVPTEAQVKNLPPGSKENPDLEPVENFHRAAYVGLAARTGHAIPFDITMTQRDVDDALTAPAVLAELKREGISDVRVTLSKEEHPAAGKAITIRYLDQAAHRPVTVQGDPYTRDRLPGFYVGSVRPASVSRQSVERRITDLLGRLPITLDEVHVTNGTILVDGYSRPVP